MKRQSDQNFKKTVEVGSIIDGRYKILKYLGRGVFGVVVKAFDLEENEIVAIKLIKKKKECRE